MGFQSINEIEKFSFEDCRIAKFELGENQIRLELEALIVKADNSQNRNYTDSYAGTVQARLEEAVLVSGYKEGWRHYNADDVLIQEIPDKALSREELTKLVNNCEGAYLFFMAKKKEEDGRFLYEAGMEFASPEPYDTGVTDSYRLELAFSKAVFCWESFLNRVQR